MCCPNPVSVIAVEAMNIMVWVANDDIPATICSPVSSAIVGEPVLFREGKKLHPNFLSWHRAKKLVPIRN